MEIRRVFAVPHYKYVPSLLAHPPVAVSLRTFASANEGGGHGVNGTRTKERHKYISAHTGTALLILKIIINICN